MRTNGCGSKEVLMKGIWDRWLVLMILERRRWSSWCLDWVKLMTITLTIIRLWT